jgi:hypothetical protein
VLYANPTFHVAINGKTSKTNKQYTGIRQGCPLSPYLFIIVMSAMFKDITMKMKRDRIGWRTLTTNELCKLLYADDTVIFGQTPRFVQHLLHYIEKESARYGLKLNTKNASVSRVSTPERSNLETAPPSREQTMPNTSEPGFTETPPRIRKSTAAYQSRWQSGKDSSSTCATASATTDKKYKCSTR